MPYRITIERYRKDHMLVDRCIFSADNYHSADTLFTQLCNKYKHKHSLCFWFTTSQQIELLAWSKWLAK